MDEDTQIIVDGDSVKVIDNGPVIVYQGTEAELDTDIAQLAGEITDLQAAVVDKTAKKAVLETYKAKFTA